ncbi:hypothetical protein DFP76_104117 [Marinomonas aquiplantarum]|uniref:Uncharacterized protein n=1 Tax=Marinomonas aquiplantarum TaxID=491951 RepID=A0A366CZR5_9GAMM|nr:hypothetical protein DFP76_104117 [Marinomonas aquiplantarum]
MKVLFLKDLNLTFDLISCLGVFFGMVLYKNFLEGENKWLAVIVIIFFVFLYAINFLYVFFCNLLSFFLKGFLGGYKVDVFYFLSVFPPIFGVPELFFPLVFFHIIYWEVRWRRSL